LLLLIVRKAVLAFIGRSIGIIGLVPLDLRILGDVLIGIGLGLIPG
jgi:hypothetical protein